MAIVMSNERPHGSESVTPRFVGEEVEPFLDWQTAVAALRDGHRLPRARVNDTLLEAGVKQLLTRSASIEGMGCGAKAVTIMPDNALRNTATVQGAFLLFREADGSLDAIIDGPLLTKWKTAADSLLAASILVQGAPRTLTVVGAGVIATALADGYTSLFPSLEHVTICARNPRKARRLASKLADSRVTASIEETVCRAASEADIVTCATGAREPIVSGAWIKPGAYVDLIGAHTPASREADDAMMARALIFVDNRETAIDSVGELSIPIARRVISRRSILGDLYDLCGSPPLVPDEKKDITVFKNGGGAHLDLMMAHYIVSIRMNEAGDGGGGSRRRPHDEANHQDCD